MVNILGANSVSGGYEISNSLRGNHQVDNAYLQRTGSSNDGRKILTFSAWIKRSVFGDYQYFFAGYNSENYTDLMYFGNDETLRVYGYGGGQRMYIITNRKFRDPSAWYHIVVQVDTTQGTASNRVKMYVNGVQETSFSTAAYPSQNLAVYWNSVNAQRVGIGQYTNKDAMGGYMSEIHNIDDAVVAPTEFGEVDDNGVWIPKAYEGSYGTDGFYLEFKQTGTSQNSSGIGADTSGNDNHFAVTNFTATDVTTDTPTNNFATFNALLPHTQTLSEGNTKVSNATDKPSLSTLGVSSGKWYAEIKFVSGTNCRIGWANENGVNENFIGANSWIKINGQIFYHDNTAINSQGQAIAAGDTIMMAVDVDAGKLWWGKNGTWDNNASGTGVPADGTNPTYTGDTGISDGGFIFFGVASGAGAIVYEANFGNAPYAISSGNADANGYGNFEYAVPSGFYSLCTKNLAEFG